MKRLFALKILALAVLIYVPRISAQTPVQVPLETPQAMTPLPPGNTWLLSSWYCIPSDCYDYEVVVTGYGTASTAAYGTCFGTPPSGGGGVYQVFNPVASATIVAEDCSDVVYLETGTATFRLTTLEYLGKTFGLEGLIVPAQSTSDEGTGIGYVLQWCNGTGTVVDFVIPC